MFESLGIAGIEFGRQLGEFFAEFFDDADGVGPVEADAGGFFLDVGGADEGGEGARDAVHDGGAVGLFLALDLLPLAEDGLGVVRVGFAEDVGVAADEFFAGFAGGILEGEGAAFGGEVGVENDLEQEVAEFFAEVGIVGLGDGVDRFAGFLEKSGTEGFVGLLAVPRTAPG